MRHITEADAPSIQQPRHPHTVVIRRQRLDGVAWHTYDVPEVLRRLGTQRAHGLDDASVAQRQLTYGPNELVEQNRTSPWRILREQLSATMVLVLIVAAVASALLGDYGDSIAILAIVVLNAALGFSQEYRAERTMAALKQLTVPTVTVRRNGGIQEIAAHELVPGDIVLLEVGERVPADGRVLDSANLRTQESALTGESAPVDKVAERLPGGELPLGDRRNMVYMGTTVSYGRGQIAVTATGMQTEIGAIATMIQAVGQEATPLQRRLDQLGRVLAAAALAIVAVIFIVGLLRGEELKLMFLTAVSMAVAAVPEGLPAVVTIALALGAQRMLKRQVLIRKLSAVETLGAVTVICADKTGTLTQNRMTVTMLDMAGQRVELADEHLLGTPAHSPGQRHSPTLALLLAAGALCNDAFIAHDGDEVSSDRVVGDPTEAALVAAAARQGLCKTNLERLFPRVAELPFDSERKRMTTVHACPAFPSALPDSLAPLWSGSIGVGGASRIAFSKGAVDGLLERCSTVWVHERAEPLRATWRERIMQADDRLAQQGMRVLGVAFRPIRAQAFATQTDVECDLTFIGLVGMIDPARPEIPTAVQTCQTAGIRPVMITGDHPLTARAIASALGIAGDSRMLTGQEIDQLTPAELENLVGEVSVFARVSPAHKLQIVRALRNRGQIVAMTGDGVNDAPALKQADIGIAMGLSGTDVAKEAADMVLRDDNFATIVAAVEEGRAIYDNLRKFIKYLLTTNSGELWVMLLAPLLGMPLPLLPLQILWMNLVTDGLPALALSVEPAERDTMQRPPRPPAEHLFARGMGRYILWWGLVMGVIALVAGYLPWHAGNPHWQTIIFTTLVLAQMAQALAVRSERDSLFRIGLWSNKPLLGALTLTLVLQLAVVYVPLLQHVFSTAALSPTDLGISVLLSTLVFWGVEFEKWLARRRGR
jgi:Ca2+-transporting ATPase